MLNIYQFKKIDTNKYKVHVKGAGSNEIKDAELALNMRAEKLCGLNSYTVDKHSNPYHYKDNPNGIFAFEALEISGIVECKQQTHNK